MADPKPNDSEFTAKPKLGAYSVDSGEANGLE